jgi:predicted site-specific integrase-resolvase
MELSDPVAKSRKLVIINKDEQNDDLVCDMTEIPTSFYARLYEKRNLANRARKKVKPL